MTAQEGFEILSAKPADVPLILTFIRELAEYEGFLPQVVATEESLLESLFGAKPAAEALIAYFDGKPIGFVVFFETFSTLMGRRGLHLDDLYIRPEMRRKGFGKALLSHLARIAVQRGCARFEWWVQDSNTNAIGFYRRIGAFIIPDISICRLTGEKLLSLASGEGSK